MQIVLASTSPRRIELLKAAGLKFMVRSPDADETPRIGESPKSLVRRLARSKARSVAESLRGDTIVIAADTIVVEPSGKKILNKPVNTKDAKRMLGLINGRTHTVYTGYCIIERSKGSEHELVRVIGSKVTMKKMSPAEIARYIRSGEPADKAGAYAAQGLGMTLIEKINGSYTNVVGLPICQVLADLESEFGVHA